MTIGPEWKERKRFFLRSLKDFGFGAKSEETVLEEAGQLSQHILNLTQDGQDYLVKGPLKGEPLLLRGCTLQRKSHLCTPRKGITWPQSQFPQSCVCERFLYSQDRSTYFPAAE
jgi:hypothetical protein